MLHVSVPVLSENINSTYPISSIKSEFLHKEKPVSASYISMSAPISLAYPIFIISKTTYKLIGIKCEYATQNVNS